MSAFCDCFEKQRACFHYEGFLSAVEDMPLETQAQRDARSCFLGKIKELIEESFFLCQTGSAAARKGKSDIGGFFFLFVIFAAARDKSKTDF